ncbi:MAG: DUF4465 domain-containing protein [Bacteroidales bacterium]|nr:DUF4465 domain-containing protein [Bacteroidales bacterium]
MALVNDIIRSIVTHSPKVYASIIAFGSMLTMAACVDENKDCPAPKIYFASDGKYEISIDDTLKLNPRIIYDRNSKYTWTANGKELSNKLDIEFVPEKQIDYLLTFKVENDNGEDEYNVNISVVNKVDFSLFDNYTIPKKSKFSMIPDTLSDFVIDDIVFSNFVNADTTMWSGFAYSNRNDIQTTVSVSTIGCAYSSTAPDNYMAVSCYSPGAIIRFGRKYTVRSIDIASDNFAYIVSKFGYVNDDGSLSVDYLKSGDYVSLHVKGLDDEGTQISEFVYDIFDCRFDRPAKYIRLSDWTTIELSSLGEVAGLQFEIESSVADFPPFFCIDNMKLQD